MKQPQWNSLNGTASVEQSGIASVKVLVFLRTGLVEQPQFNRLGGIASVELPHRNSLS